MDYKVRDPALFLLFRHCYEEDRHHKFYIAIDRIKQVADNKYVITETLRDPKASSYTMQGNLSDIVLDLCRKQALGKGMNQDEDEDRDCYVDVTFLFSEINQDVDLDTLSPSNRIKYFRRNMDTLQLRKEDFFNTDGSKVVRSVNEHGVIMETIDLGQHNWNPEDRKERFLMPVEADIAKRNFLRQTVNTYVWHEDEGKKKYAE